MANITLGWQNRIDSAILSAGSWLASLPRTNMQTRQVQKVARSSDATNASTKFVADFGQARVIGVVALVVHNISVSGRVRITANSSNSFGSPAFDSGWITVWPSGIIPLNLLEWEDDNFWLGTLTAEARAGYQAPFIYLLATAQNYQYWQTEVDDTGNADGYVQIGRPFMSTVWSPAVNYAYGAGLGFEDPTVVATTLSGEEFYDPKSKYRSFTCALEWLTSTEAYSYALELQRLSGTSGEVLVIPDQADSANIVSRSFVGRLRTLGKIAQPSFNTYALPLEFKELL